MSHPPHDWYKRLSAHLGDAYLRYAFTTSTASEVDFLWEELGVHGGHRVLDVGMGPGRHIIELAGRGADVVGIDISPEFVAIARRRAQEAGLGGSYFVMDAHNMPFEEEFDAVISICEGAFGLGLDDLEILRGISRALKPGGVAAVAAVNLLFVMKHMADEGELDPSTLLYRESTEVTGGDGSTENFEMWNSPYTPREMAWIANGAGLQPRAVFGTHPGKFARDEPTTDHPELLLVAEKLKSE